MSQHYRRVAFADFMRDAARIFDSVEARGETILVKRGGKTFMITTWQARPRRVPAKPQPPNMQDSLWSTGGLGAPTELARDAGAGAKRAIVAEAPAEYDPSPQSGDGASRSGTRTDASS